MTVLIVGGKQQLIAQEYHTVTLGTLGVKLIAKGYALPVPSKI
jgi:hypothetical protein